MAQEALKNKIYPMSTKVKGFALKPEKVYIILSAVVCLLTSFIMPPLSHSDPGYHISKSYLMFSKYDETPEALRIIPPQVKQSIIEKNDLLTKPLALNDGVALNINKPVTVWRYDFKGGITGMEERAGISDLGHLPQAVGMLMVRTLVENPSYHLLYYTGVFFNWLASTALIYLAIKYINKAKWAVFMVATIPTIIFLSSGLGYDALTNAVCILFFSIALNFYIQKKTISKWQLLALLAVSIAALLTKKSNILLLLFIPFLPSAVFKDTRPIKYIRHKMRLLSLSTKRVVLLVSLLLALLILCLIANKATAKLAMEFDTSRLDATYEAVKSLFRSIFRQDLAQSYNPNWQRSGPDGVFRSIFSYKSLMPFWVVTLYSIFILTVFIKSAEDITRKSIKRIAAVSTGVFLIVSLAIWLGMMIEFSYVTKANGLIDGVQGRYFSAYIILLLPGIIYMAHRTKTRIAAGSKHLPILCCVVALGANLYYLYLMQATYYLHINEPLFIL